MPGLSYHVEKRLDKKGHVVSKLMTSQPGQQTIAIHILPNVSRSKNNQTIKVGHLIEYNMRNILFKSHSQNVAENLFPDSFLKTQN